MIKTLYEEALAYLEQHPELKKQENKEDMWDFRDMSEDVDDYEEDEEEFEDYYEDEEDEW